MLFKTHAGCIITCIVMLVLGASMALIGTLAAGQALSWAGFFTTWGSAFTINFLAALVFPVDAWGATLARALHAKPASFPWAMICTLVSTFVFVTIVSLGMTLLQVGAGPAFWPAWLHLYPILFGAGYVIALVVSIPAARAAQKIAAAAQV